MNIKNLFGKIILVNSLSMVKAQPKLLFFPAISSLINFLLLISIGHPLYQYEINRSQHQLPAHHFTIFYIVLLIYYYFRNIINAWLTDATTCAIHSLQEKNITTPLKNSFKHANKNFLRSFRWITLLSFFGFWIIVFQNFLLKCKIYQKFVGNENWRMAATLAQVLLTIEKMSIRSALKRSSKLLADTWGHAPLEQNYSLSGLYYKYLLLTLVPPVISFLFQNIWATYIAIAISVIYYLFLSCIVKILIQLITFSLHHYCTHQKTLLPFTNEIIKQAYFHRED